MEEEKKKKPPLPPMQGKAFIAKAIQGPWNELVEKMAAANVKRRNKVYPAASSILYGWISH